MFLDVWEPTIEDQYNKSVTVNGMSYTVTILDVGSHHDTNIDVASLDGFIVCHETGNQESFTHAQKLVANIRKIKNYTTQYPNIRWPIVVTETKCDDDDDDDDGPNSRVGIQHSDAWTVVQTSAKHGRNVEQVFEILLEEIETAKTSLAMLIRPTSCPAPPELCGLWIITLSLSKDGLFQGNARDLEGHTFLLKDNGNLNWLGETMSVTSTMFVHAAVLLPVCETFWMTENASVFTAATVHGKTIEFSCCLDSHSNLVLSNEQVYPISYKWQSVCKPALMSVRL